MQKMLLILAIGLVVGCADDTDPTTPLVENNSTNGGMNIVPGPNSDPNATTPNADPNNGGNSMVVPPSQTWVVGESVAGRPLVVELYGTSGPVLYILSAIHGDERLSVIYAERIRSWLLAGLAERAGIRIFFFQTGNPDGVIADSRENARGVDLNRNFPSDNFDPGAGGGDTPLSEPESQAIFETVGWVDPAAVISVHCCAPTFDWDGPGEELAETMSAAMDPAIAFPTVRLGSRPGSLGSLIGVDLGRPIITVEFALGNGTDPTAQLEGLDLATEAAAFWTAENGLLPGTLPADEIVGESSPIFEAVSLGESAGGVPIRAERVGFGPGADTYVLSGFEGDGYLGEHVAEHVRSHWIRKLRHDAGRSIWFATGASPDALAFGGTVNSDGDDVVADFAAGGSTTPEGVALADWLGTSEPSLVWVFEDGDTERITVHGPDAAALSGRLGDVDPPAMASARYQPVVDGLTALGHTVVLVEIDDVYWEAQGISDTNPDWRPSPTRFVDLVERGFE